MHSICRIENKSTINLIFFIVSGPSLRCYCPSKQDEKSQKGQKEKTDQKQTLNAKLKTLVVKDFQFDVVLKTAAGASFPCQWKHSVIIFSVLVSQGAGRMLSVRIEDYFVKVIFGWGILAAMFTSGPVKVNVFVDANR